MADGASKKNPGHDVPQHRIRKPKNPLRPCTPSVLPCRIRHDGPVNASPRYWNPTLEEVPSGKDGDRQLTAYFRGRRLLGRTINLPTGYTGALLRKSEAVEKDSSLKDDAVAELEARRGEMDPAEYVAEEDDLRAAIRAGDFDAGDVSLVDQVGVFDGLVVWGHDRVPDESDEPFVRGVEEWIALASAIHTNGKTTTDETSD